MSFAAFLSMAVELADCTRPVSFVVGSTFAFFGLATLFGGGAAVAKFLAAPAGRSHAAGLHGTARVKQGCRASAAGHAGGGAHLDMTTPSLIHSFIASSVLEPDAFQT